MADKHVFIIDRDKDFVDAISQRFKACGYIPAGITNSAAFFQLIDRISPFVVILSDNLVNPAWIELMNRVRHSSFESKFMFYLLYSEKVTALDQQMKLYGIKRSFLKPFKFTELLNSLRNCES